MEYHISPRVAHFRMTQDLHPVVDARSLAHLYTCAHRPPRPHTGAGTRLHNMEWDGTWGVMAGPGAEGRTLTRVWAASSERSADEWDGWAPPAPRRSSERVTLSHTSRICSSDQSAEAADRMVGAVDPVAGAAGQSLLSASSLGALADDGEAPALRAKADRGVHRVRPIDEYVRSGTTRATATGRIAVRPETWQQGLDTRPNCCRAILKDEYRQDCGLWLMMASHTSPI